MRAALLVNINSGALKGDASAVVPLIESLEAAGFVLHRAGERAYFSLDDMAELLAAPIEVVLVHGGDGTINAVAEQLLDSHIALGIIPGGTMNLMARDLRIPLDRDSAVTALATGEKRRIDVGRVNERLFLCMSVLGMPARLARHRESQRGRWNPFIWLKLLRATAASLVRYPRLMVRMSIEGRELVLWTRAIVIANNPMDSGLLHDVNRSRMDRGELAIYVVRSSSLWRFAWVALAFYAGDPREHPHIDVFHARELEIGGEAKTLRVMNDGEVSRDSPPLRYRILPKALTVLAPAAPVVAAAEADASDMAS